jgi:hypothetical protein
VAAAIGIAIGTVAQPVADQHLPAVARRRVEARNLRIVGHQAADPILRAAVRQIVDLISHVVVHRDVALGLIAAARQTVGRILPAMIAVVRGVLERWASVRWAVVPISRGVTRVPSGVIVLPVVAAANATAAVNRIPPAGSINSKVK